MSTCPEKDIHSIYLDNELPVSYLAKYESHLSECKSCQAELAKIKKLRMAYEADSKSLTLSKTDMEQSFSRLQARLSYKKITSAVDNKPFVFRFKNTIRYVATGVAAAVAVALIVPVRINKAAKQIPVATASVNSFIPTARSAMPGAETVSFNNGYSNGNVYSDMGSLFLTPNTTEVFSMSEQKDISRFGSIPTDTPLRTTLADYDVFFPEPQENMAVKQSKPKEFSFHFNSPLANISFEIGSGN